jgi:hypothetical protein
MQGLNDYTLYTLFGGNYLMRGSHRVSFTTCFSSVSMRMRNSSAGGCDAGEFVIVSPAWKWNSWSGNAPYLMPMPIIEGGKRKITVGMWNTAWRRFCHANKFMAMTCVKRSNPRELMNMHRPAILSSNIQVMRVI